MSVKNIALVIVALIIAIAGILFFEYHFAFTGKEVVPVVQAPDVAP